MPSEDNIPQPVKIFPEVYETRKFITATTTSHMFPSWVSWIHFTITC